MKILNKETDKRFSVGRVLAIAFALIYFGALIFIFIIA